MVVRNDDKAIYFHKSGSPKQIYLMTDTLQWFSREEGWTRVLLWEEAGDILKAWLKEEEAKDCKHLNARVEGNELFGFVTCPDCNKCVNQSEVVNNLLSAMRESLVKGART